MKESLEFLKNEDSFKLAISKMNQLKAQVKLGGGKKRMEKLHAKGKLGARERIDLLVDKDSTFLELSIFAAKDMYQEYGGCPAAGVITGLGHMEGRLCVIVANDPTVHAGAWFPMAGKKNLRAQEIALENRLPIVYLVDSAGIFLPLQEDIFADKEHFGRVFRNNAKLSALGVPQISAIMGACVAGGAYLPAMSDESIIVEGTGSIFLAGPHLVKAAIGETVDKETLGGADTHSSISGLTDYKVPNDEACIAKIRTLMGQQGPRPTIGFDRVTAKAPSRPTSDLAGIYPEGGLKPYESHELIDCIVDEGSFTSYKAEYGTSMICGYARIDGWSVGIVANNRAITKNGKGELQVGGVIYSDSADKATRFILNCNQKKIPLVFLHDVTGFMVGTRSEHGGIIKDGAKLVNAMANSVVPKISIVVGNSYGAGNYAMCGRAYDPRFMFAWPTGKIAVMGGEQAAKVLLQLKVGALKAKGETLSKEAETKLFNEIKQQYEDQASIYHAASKLWVDEIINPFDTRAVISRSIEAANHGTIEEFKLGVIQV